jgi:hypothetical protein
MPRNIILTLLAFIISACSTAFKVDPVSAQLRAPGLVYFVENHGQDKRRLDQIIASELKDKGITATNGFKSDRPAKFDVLVVYEDRWQWDMTNYLINMRIDLRSPTTNVLLGTGSSYQTSLARKAEEEVIKDIISGMFAKNSK